MKPAGMIMPLEQKVGVIKGKMKPLEAQDNSFQNLLDTKKQAITPLVEETKEQISELINGEEILNEIGSLLENLDELTLEGIEIALKDILDSLNNQQVDIKNAQEVSDLFTLLEEFQNYIQLVSSINEETLQLQNLLDEIKKVIKEDWNSAKKLDFYFNDVFMLKPLEEFQKYLVTVNRPNNFERESSPTEEQLLQSELVKRDSSKSNNVLTYQPLVELQKYKETFNTTNEYEKYFSEVFRKMEELLSGITSKAEMNKAAPKLLELLELWSQLKTNSGTGISTELMNSINIKESKVWEGLVKSFEKREKVASKLAYSTEAKVTVTDISKWLDKALGDSFLVDKVNVAHSNLHTSTPLSRVEQYVIYTNQSNLNQPASQQLLDQFQQVMKKSKFLTLPNGSNQLSIRLQPNHLGDMMVRLTQVNGEMTVKILVATQTAKELLETNIKQLKNMFSPHQVVIEKQEWNVQHAASSERGQNQQHEESHEQHPDGSSDQEHRKDNPEDSTFHELLMNVKV
ncbi:hypothetical protein D8M04_10720 [Oceanobacillus piezotolerans]|uniref:Flagellar hook-length control protein-like C-terminal domain-containing protein n=1 Tax=Oceanobacillus piezotolerans TaxID=2448030 RepID=A0A498D6N5_9BACI|nr:flagellar hook-length control protein FliK [Oceanobacillus piezotolerans]RLL45319.1 hypothetical protein D8M04_10720 [Oceanobacillus piezotolerans]